MKNDFNEKPYMGKIIYCRIRIIFMQTDVHLQILTGNVRLRIWHDAGTNNEVTYR